MAFAFPDEWLPKSVLCLRNYSLQKCVHDLVAVVMHPAKLDTKGLGIS
jgi:hypothetical protein